MPLQTTGWYSSRQKPKRVGLYRTYREDVRVFGVSYSYWDGAAWQAVAGWSVYHTVATFVWQGLAVAQVE